MSAEIAHLIAHAAFFGLLWIGWSWGELGNRTASVFVALWLCGYVAASFVAQGSSLLTSYVAILDVVLVFLVFKGDVRLG